MKVEEGGRQDILRDGKESRETFANSLAYERGRAGTGVLDLEAPVPSFPCCVERVGKLEGVSREHASTPADFLTREVPGRRRGVERLSSAVDSVPVASVSFEMTIAPRKVPAPASPTSTSTSRRDECERVRGISQVGWDKDRELRHLARG
jgi:hypothetical protein